MSFSPSIYKPEETFKYLYHIIVTTKEGHAAVLIIIVALVFGLAVYFIARKYNIKLKLRLFDSFIYKRPYCERCKVIYSKLAINRMLSCQKCGDSLILKDFNPYLKLWAGLGIIGLGCLTFLVKEFPVMWIGGFIFGALLIANGFENWQKVKNIDGERVKYRPPLHDKIKSFFTFSSHVIIRCSSCGQKLRLPKTKKTLNITCPKCKYSFKRL